MSDKIEVQTEPDIVDLDGEELAARCTAAVHNLIHDICLDDIQATMTVAVTVYLQLCTEFELNPVEEIQKVLAFENNYHEQKQQGSS